ncbi:MAG: UDP-N-acetylmuramoyl-L-alanine--D-glutamate ligase [Oscillospiraceae bacterium]|nr:UDP-N-acetylmuramoyl-L-alanine--D-glutamate ligase [Oscillospiraceae bacterium]
MLDKLHDFFANKRVLILGCGLEGKSTIRLLEKLNCATKIDVIEQYHHTTPLPEDYDVVMKSPGIPLFDNPSESIRNKITCQVDLFLRFARDSKQNLPTVIGITGTKGKSTTSSLIHHILCKCGKKSKLIGNIGVPPLDICVEMSELDFVVAELSCHQLEYSTSSPQIAVYLNLFEEHLDHYVSFLHYRRAKENIYAYQKFGDFLVFGDNTAHGLVPVEGVTVFDERKVIECENLRGKHNQRNVGVAVKVAELAGIPRQTAISAVNSFSGLEHRLEMFAKLRDVKWVNDSIGTIPSATIAAVEAFPETDTLIIGGMNRGIDYSTLVEFLNTRHDINVIALPDSGHMLADLFLVEHPKIQKVADLSEAVILAKEITKKCCILSPAAASYGFYKNFEERGQHFKKLVRN